jgi:uncharacterized protein DUF4437
MRPVLRVGMSLLLGSMILAPACVLADGGDAMYMNTNEIKWGDAPPSIPKGAKIAVLYGDPGKSGPFVARLMMPAGYKIAPHWHSQAEQLTVISGAFYLGDGDAMDAAKAHAMKAGGFHYLPAKAHHYAFTKSPTVVQLNGDGPFDINYINEKDDPQKMAKK